MINLTDNFVLCYKPAKTSRRNNQCFFLSCHYLAMPSMRQKKERNGHISLTCVTGLFMQNHYSRLDASK